MIAANAFVAPFAGQVGDRIELLSLDHDGPAPISRGATGTILAAHRVYCDNTVQVLVHWDTGSSLSLIWPLDKFRIVQRRAAA